MKRGGKIPEVVRLVEAGHDDAEIAKMTGLAQSRVQAIRLEETDVRREHGLQYSKEIKARALAFAEDKCPVTEIARTLDIPWKTVRKWIPDELVDTEWNSTQRWARRTYPELFKEIR